MDVAVLGNVNLETTRKPTFVLAPVSMGLAMRIQNWRIQRNQREEEARESWWPLTKVLLSSLMSF